MTKIGSVSRHLALGILLVAGLTLSPSHAWALGSTPVTVVNPTSAPVPTTDANEPALQPFQATLFPHSSTSNEATDTVAVPSGKRLVIEYYSSQPQDLSGGAAGMVITTTAGGTFVQYIVYVNANTTNQVNQITRIYADPGSAVEAFAFNANASSTAGFVTISGHLVNVP